MKQLIIALLIFVAVIPAFGQDVTGLLTTMPKIMTGVDTVKGTSGGYTTSWLQVGYSPNASDGDNHNIRQYNPESFTLALLLTSVQGDTAQLSDAYFEQIYDTTATEFWNADSSNVFIDSGTFTHYQYGNWRFEPLEDTNRYYLYPLRLFVGGYVRMVFATTVDDTFEVEWKLICEQ